MAKVNDDPIRANLRQICKELRKEYPWIIGRTFTKALWCGHHKPHAYEVRLLCAKHMAIMDDMIAAWMRRLGGDMFSVEGRADTLSIVIYKLIKE
jgi:hypothetical protein